MKLLTIFFLLLICLSCSKKEEQIITLTIPSDEVHSACTLGDSLLVLVRRVKNETDTSSNNFTSDLYLFDSKGKLLNKIETPNCKSVVYDDGKIYTSSYSALYIYDTDFEIIETIDFPKKMNNILTNLRIDSLYSYFTNIRIISGRNGYQLITNQERLRNFTPILYGMQYDYTDFHIHKTILYVENKKYKLQ